MRCHGWSDSQLGGTGRSDGGRSNGGGGVSNGWLFLINGAMSVCNDIHVMSEGNSIMGGVIWDWEGVGKATVDAVMVMVASNNI